MVVDAGCDGDGGWVKCERGGLPSDGLKMSQTPLFIACTDARTQPRVHPSSLSSLIAVCLHYLTTPPCPLGITPRAEAYLYYQDLPRFCESLH